MKRLKQALALTLLLIMALGTQTVGYAQGKSSDFSDLDRNHWAYGQVKKMMEMGVLDGYTDGSFRPNQQVLREQFAKMMVNGLQIKLETPSKATFADVPKSYWAFPYVESAKPYLTGFASGSTLKFKPSSDAVREDMAVALVKALGYENLNADEDVLSQFEDADKISKNLRKYVAIAVQKKLMNGSKDHGDLYFNAQSTLTRAEASVLMYNVIQDEKVVFNEPKPTEETKVVVTDGVKVAASVSGTKVTVNWTHKAAAGLQGFKVVASKNNSAPKYPEDGYFFWITDLGVRSKTFDISTAYNGGDFGGRLEPGKSYYFSVTAVYSDKKVAGNAIKLTIPKTVVEEPVQDYVKPTVVGSATDNGVRLQWNAIRHDKFQGYKVVVSPTDSTPSYPDNGYCQYITNAGTTSAALDVGTRYNLNGSESAVLKAGQKYWFSVTALYSDGKRVAGNAVQLTMPGTAEQALVKPVLNGEVTASGITLNWNSISHDQFQGYKVLASATDSTPSYPDNGYVKYITDKDTTQLSIKAGDSYESGSGLATFQTGKKYYFAITALYDSGRVTGNTVVLTLPVAEVEKPVVKPQVTGSVDAEKVTVQWNAISHPRFEGYKVVASETNVSPSYPADGYVVYLTNPSTTTFSIKAGDEYNGIKFESGKSYYFSVTALYSNDEKIPGNSVRLTLP